jgi:hypothetical protein
VGSLIRPIGNFMTEALFPIALLQDPRYFVKGKGRFWKRTGYAVSREVITRADNGHNQFNPSELAGNAVAAGISNLYYPAADRSLGPTADKWGQQLGLDTFLHVPKRVLARRAQQVIPPLSETRRSRLRCELPASGITYNQVSFLS